MSAFGDQIGVGGDSSVRWTVKVRDPRAANAVTVCDAKDVRLNQQGIAETPEAGDSEIFNIRIKLPRGSAERRKFLEDLIAAAKDPKDGRVEFRLPIEHGNMDKRSGDVDQILISWLSRREYKAFKAWKTRGRGKAAARKNARKKKR
jgi:hypothetical protein